MTAKEIFRAIDEVAPKSLSDEWQTKYGAYDNSGLLVGTGEETEKIVFSLDFSAGAVKRAIAEGAKLIVTHHPAIYAKIADVRVSDPLGSKIAACLREGISVISMHLNLDAAADGIDENLMNAVLIAAQRAGTGLHRTGKTCGVQGIAPRLMIPLSEGRGYGRVYPLSATNGGYGERAEDVTLGALAEELKKELKAERVAVYGDPHKSIRRVGSFCGAGGDEESAAFALRHGADAIVSSDFRHHVLASASESGLAVIAPTHYAAENYGFEKFYAKIGRLLPLPCVLHTDGELL